MKVGKVEIVKKSWTVPVSNIEDLKVCPNCERYRKALEGIMRHQELSMRGNKDMAYPRLSTTWNIAREALK